MPAAAQSLRECRRATVRRLRQFGYLYFPVAPTVAHILAWVVGSTDFPASRNGVGTVLVAARSLRECWRARRRDGAGCVRALGVSSHTDACAHLGAGGGCNRFCHREMVLGLCRWLRTVCESVGERLRDGAGRLPTFCFQSHRCMPTSWRAVDMTDFATEKWCCNCHTVCESVGEGWHDGTGRLPAFGLLMCM